MATDTAESEPSKVWEDDIDNGKQPCGRCMTPYPAELLRIPEVISAGQCRIPMCEKCLRVVRKEFIHSCTDNRVEKTAKVSLVRTQRFLGLAKEAGEDAAPTIHRTLNELVDQFGGIEQFAATWHEQLSTAMETRPGSAVVLCAFRDIAKLLAVATPRMESETDYSQMTDEDLEQLRVRETAKLLALDMMEKFPESADMVERYLLQMNGNGPVISEESETAEG